MTKFEVGRQLGFVGENGFTSLPQDLLVRDLQREPDATIRNQMLSNSDGTSDKYARMIAGWLTQVGWVEIAPKLVNVTVAGQAYSYEIPQAYTITDSGQAALRRAEGRSRHPRTPKNVYFEMLATKASSRKFLRVRRALLITALNGRGFRTLAQIQSHLTQAGLTVDPAAIADDLTGLENIGLQVERNATGAYRLLDTVEGLVLPSFGIADTLPGDVWHRRHAARRRSAVTRHSPKPLGQHCSQPTGAD